MLDGTEDVGLDIRPGRDEISYRSEDRPNPSRQQLGNLHLLSSPLCTLVLLESVVPEFAFKLQHRENGSLNMEPQTRSDLSRLLRYPHPCHVS